MKHALLITAYKDFDQLHTLIDQFDSDFNIYVHIDGKSKISDKQLQGFRQKENVRIAEAPMKVNWGGFNHLQSYLSLSKIALNNPENTLFHLITGQDFPIKNKKSFDELLEKNKSKEICYLDYEKMPAMKLWHLDGGMGRFHYYSFYDWFDAKTKTGEKIHALIRKIQLLIRVKRKINLKEELYGGSTYWTLPRKALKYVIDFEASNPKFHQRFRYTFCPEEMYFQTILMDSPFVDTIVNDNLRYIDWENGKGGGPAVLGHSDLKILEESNSLFARKIDSQEIINHLIESNKIKEKKD
ncbi:MAG: beta-1,6-N-acetylglucosaminyltransferase [Flavobacteriales bacterium]